MNEIIEFKAIIEKEIKKSVNFKMYAVMPSEKNEKIKYNKYGNVTISGDIQELSLGIEYNIKCKENKYGYEVNNITREKPTTKTQIEKFLCEVLTKNQTKVLLKVYPNIIDKVINNDLDDIDLTKTKGIKDKTFEVIKRKIIENFHLIDFINEFKEYNISISLARKLYEKFASVEIMKEKMNKDPYETLCLINGVSFKNADKIILSIEKNKQLKKSIQRIKACIKFCLNENEKKGNTWINLEKLYNKCYELVPESIDLIVDAIQDDDIYIDNKRRIAWKNTFKIELYLAKILASALKKNRRLIIDCSKYYRIDGNNLTKEQQGVLKNFCNSNVSLLVGNAGSGKSFCTQSIINLCDDNNLSYILMTPTGKSAIVLSEYTGCDAGTIHRKLEYNPAYGWGFNKKNKLEVDVVIVDENGMTDIRLMNHLLEAIDFNKTRILFIQDDAQLPSVSCGNCAYDLINSGIIPLTRLTQVFRYGEGGLLQVATKIRNSEKYLDKNNNDIQVFGTKGDYSFIPTENEYIKDYVIGIYQKLLEQGNSPIDIMVLSAKNINENGTIDLNKSLQENFNPYKEKDKYIKYGDNTFRKNDLVIQIKNNYKALNDECEEVVITNGEIGTVKNIEHNKMYVQYKRDMIIYEKEDLDQLQLAYSISIHKSQGSGVKNVILITPTSHKWTLNKNLMYVGITRAKEKCFHIGLAETVNFGLTKSAELQRNTFLQDLLIEKYNAA